ncbi:2-isopropylmalate synthase [Streptomyces sp. NPDC021218]|uniref:2-isopropylmalate synthase n=1 Tax=Streptomyces sp. NPDC021218 TaxID=3365119 RepID=UPI003794984F
MPYWKYDRYPAVNLADRLWPSKEINSAPQWCGVDLRDGNQALIQPMDIQRKRDLFDLQIRMGFKEIEVGYPAASQTDYDFIRLLIEQSMIPDDVVIQVITPARSELIHRTFDSVRGARYAIIHLYNSTSCLQREVVFGLDQERTTELAVRATQLCRKLAEETPDTYIQYEYTPESFTGTELDFAAAICNSVSSTWEPSVENKMIINLPATVEMSTPNVFADRIEWMQRNLDNREKIVLSIHPHNDRGTAVAAAELALMAGAERIEGCLFGNGERSGNVDLITLGMNLFSQGIDPMLDFSNLIEVAATVEHCTRMPVHPRHPYAGELVHTAFSGTHQDAIKKGFDAQQRKAAALNCDPSQIPWAVPYLPIDPKDVGRDYETVVRVNSQSGKAGAAFVLRANHQLDLPRALQVEFARVIQKQSETNGAELAPEAIWAIFEQEYLQAKAPVSMASYNMKPNLDGVGTLIACSIRVDGAVTQLHGSGEGPVEALLDALTTVGIKGLTVRFIERQSLRTAEDRCATYVQLEHRGSTAWGVAVETDPQRALLMALLSGVNKILVDPCQQEPRT